MDVAMTAPLTVVVPQVAVARRKRIRELLQINEALGSRGRGAALWGGSEVCRGCVQRPPARGSSHARVPALRLRTHDERRARARPARRGARRGPRLHGVEAVEASTLVDPRRGGGPGAGRVDRGERRGVRDVSPAELAAVDVYHGHPLRYRRGPVRLAGRRRVVEAHQLRGRPDARAPADPAWDWKARLEPPSRAAWARTTGPGHGFAKDRVAIRAAATDQSSPTALRARARVADASLAGRVGAAVEHVVDDLGAWSASARRCPGRPEVDPSAAREERLLRGARSPSPANGTRSARARGARVVLAGDRAVDLEDRALLFPDPSGSSTPSESVSIDDRSALRSSLLFLERVDAIAVALRHLSGRRRRRGARRGSEASRWAGSLKTSSPGTPGRRAARGPW